MNYRPDIDGLRAVAVLFVLFFHGKLGLFPSGFIGVDIFFVISGFLITAILQHSLEQKNFSLIQFYNARLWRLQPVFLCLVFGTLLLSLFFYLPEDLLPYSKSARKASIFISNSYFAKETTAYFATDNQLLPLLHTWSLSIEWQCYLMLPLLLYLLYSWVNKAYIPKLFYGLTLLFFVISLYDAKVDPGRTYYQLLSRIFEFLIGSCIVFLPKPRLFKPLIFNGLSLLALFTLFYLARCSHIFTGFPNFYALVLCAATGLLLFLGKQEVQPLGIQLLSLKPLVFIGLLSYSLYIWHWPVLVYFRYLEIEETRSAILFIFILIFLLAYCSWRFVEKPLRQYKQLPFVNTLALLVVAPLILIHSSDHLIKEKGGYPARFQEALRIEEAFKPYKASLRAACLHDRFAPINKNCILGSKEGSSKKALLFGDSHANHFWGLVDVFAEEANISVLTDSMAACLALPGLRLWDWNHKPYKACQQQVRYYYELIQKNHYDFVILGQNWEGYLEHKLIPEEGIEQVKMRIEAALDQALNQISLAGSRPVLIKAIATGKAYSCFLKHIKQRTAYQSELCDFMRDDLAYKWQEALFHSMKIKYPSLIIIDPKKVQCIKKRCKADVDKLPLFRDPGHLTDYASYHLALNYLSHYKNPLLPKSSSREKDRLG